MMFFRLNRRVDWLVEVNLPEKHLVSILDSSWRQHASPEYWLLPTNPQGDLIKNLLNQNFHRRENLKSHSFRYQSSLFERRLKRIPSIGCETLRKAPLANMSPISDGPRVCGSTLLLQCHCYAPRGSICQSDKTSVCVCVCVCVCVWRGGGRYSHAPMRIVHTTQVRQQDAPLHNGVCFLPIQFSINTCTSVFWTLTQSY
jgi:hypothetical protein